MKYEKSCGALVYRKSKGKIQLLLIKHSKGGHWSFPKGHVENYETETETALREVKEETGIDIVLQDNFRHTVTYNPSNSIEKDVVYFLGEAKHSNVQRQIEEISDIKWVDFDKTLSLLTYNNDVYLLEEAHKYFAIN